MTLDENNAIEAELLRTLDDCEYAASCVRASLGNLYNTVKYPLSDARAAAAEADAVEADVRAAAKATRAAVLRAEAVVNTFRAIRRDKEED